MEITTRYIVKTTAQKENNIRIITTGYASIIGSDFEFRLLGKYPDYRIICKVLGKFESLTTCVADRKGRDMRYAIDPTRIHSEPGWLPETRFVNGIQAILDNKELWQANISGKYKNYHEKMDEKC